MSVDKQVIDEVKSDGFICGAWTIREQGPILNYEQPYIREQYVYRCDLPAGHEGDHVDSVLLTNWSGPAPEELAKAKVAMSVDKQLPSAVQELIDAANDFLDHNLNHESFKRLESAIAKAEAEVDVETRWIDVEQKKPVGSDHLLLVLGPDDVAMQCVGYWNRLMREWVVNGERMEGLYVTHWRSLPAPPEQVEYQGKDK